LPGFLFFVRRSPPDVFQDFVSVEEPALVEQRDSAKVFVLANSHSHYPHTKENLAP
jgi:hypothetical protein